VRSKLPDMPHLVSNLDLCAATEAGAWRKLFGDDMNEGAEWTGCEISAASQERVTGTEDFTGKLTLFRFDDGSAGFADSGHRVLFSVRAEDEHPDLVDTLN
jgi:hypothetical protein